MPEGCGALIFKEDDDGTFADVWTDNIDFTGPFTGRPELGRMLFYIEITRPYVFC